MNKLAILFTLMAALALGATPVAAQRLTFQKSFQVQNPAIVDVLTDNGKVFVTVGDGDRVEITGTVTIRADWNVPANAEALARQVADQPPVVLDANTVRLRLPADGDERRAVTLSYQVRVPRSTEVRIVSQSGALDVNGVGGAVSVRTQSGAIALTGLGGAAEVSTGSGAVSVALDGPGSVNVKTSSSGIELRGLKGGLTVSTNSGRVALQGRPGAPWNVTTGSSAITLALDQDAGLNLEATTRSGSVQVNGTTPIGSVTKRRIVATLGAGGPLVQFMTRSGSIRIDVGRRGTE